MSEQVLELLEDILICDHVILLTFSMSKKRLGKNLWPKMEEIFNQGLMDQKRGHVRGQICKTRCLDLKEKGRTRMLLGLASGTPYQESVSSVILGPLGGNESEEAENFRRFWGFDLCQLRRFEDGSIRESVMIHNPWGPMYLLPAIIAHLIKIHFSDQEIQMELLNLPADLLPNHYQTRSHVKNMRTIVKELSHFLTEMSDPSLPLRQVRAVGSEQHCEGDRNGCQAPQVTGKNSIVNVKKSCLVLKKGANISPAMVNSIPLILDITRKKHLDSEMFTCLSTAYLISTKKSLEAKGLFCMLKDLKLYVIYKGFTFRLEVEPSLEIGVDANSRSGTSIETFFQTMGMRYPAWAGTCHLIQKWISSSMLEYSVPKEVIFLLICHIFTRNRDQIGLSVESAVLKFFHFLSFHDFDKKIVTVDTEENELQSLHLSAIQMQMQGARHLLPPIVLITPFDGINNVSKFSKAMVTCDTKRLINLAKKSLHALVSKRPDDVLDWKAFQDSFGVDLKIYDVIIYLNPLQIPRIKTNTSTAQSLDSSERAFPIVDFNPIHCYITELKENFKNLARFYYGKLNSVIGVKLERTMIDQTPISSFKNAKGYFVTPKEQLVPNVEAIINDFKILGEGLVKNIECNIHI